ncbi:MAG TPA: ankyrin repeat domain-containing protein [Bacteroidales bacterium]|nr:ankyrin repeat domain-containing protein [Bacteroidales bacterium]
MIANAQWNTVKSAIDTTDYIPSYFQDYIQYNLMIAASKGYISEIERMMDMGADINATTIEGATPLIFAVSNNKPDAVRTILKYKPEIDKKTLSSETALMVAVKNQFFDIAEMLIRAGADIDYTDINGVSSLHFAALYGYLDITDLLLYYNAAVDSKSAEGTTPLLTSVWAGYIDIADLLLQNGADPDAKDIDGFTPFLLAAYYGDTLMMDLLKKHGADINAKTNKGFSALSLAIVSEQTGTVEYLIRTEKNWASQGINSSNPYTVAAKYGRKDIITKLRENNIPGRVSYGIDQITVDVSARITGRDLITGASLTFREPLLNAGFLTGIDFKPWYSRVLVKEADNIFFQYWERGYLAYAGIFKDLKISEIPNQYKFVFTASLLGGYSFGNEMKGTYKNTESKFSLIPSAALQLQFRNVRLSAGLEYLESEFYKVGPLWLRTSIGYNYYFDNIRTKIKPPRWF